jgi:hypothetical protein
MGCYPSPERGGWLRAERAESGGVCFVLLNAPPPGSLTLATLPASGEG